MVEENHAGGGDGALQLEEGVQTTPDLRVSELVSCHLHPKQTTSESREKRDFSNCARNGIDRTT